MITEKINHIEEVSEKYEIPAELIAAIIVKEQVSRSIPDDIALVDTFIRGGAHSVGPGAIFPNTAYQSWLEGIEEGYASPRDFYKNFAPYLFGDNSHMDDPAWFNFQMMSALMDKEINIETIALVLRSNYNSFVRDFETYASYFETFTGCLDNMYVPNDPSTGFTDENIPLILSYYNTGKGWIFKDKETSELYRNEDGVRYGTRTQKYLPNLRDIVALLKD